MIGADLTIGLLASLVVMNYQINKSVLYPPFIFSTMWLLVLGLYRLNLVEMNTVHAETFAVLSVGAVLFSIGGACALLVPRRIICTRMVLFRRPPDNVVSTPDRSMLMKYCIICVLAVGVCFMVGHVFTNAGQGTSGGFLQRARDVGFQAQAEGQPQFPIYSYVLLWSIYASVLFQLERRDDSSWMMTGIAFIACIFSTGRTGILLLGSALTCVHLMKANRHSFLAAMRLIRWPFLAFLLLWTLLIFTNKDTTVFGVGIGATILLFIVSYTVGPIVAFDYFLKHPEYYVGTPHHTFKFFLGLASFMHILPFVPMDPMLREYSPYVSVPFPTNVYTMYRFYITDFGLYVALGIMLLIGFLHTLVYLKARTGSELGIYFFALTLYPAIMVIFEDQYSSFGSYLDILLLGWFYTLMRSRMSLRLSKMRLRINHT
jgi:oligosaccharide repeat unit polymerase